MVSVVMTDGMHGHNGTVNIGHDMHFSIDKHPKQGNPCRDGVAYPNSIESLRSSIKHRLTKFSDRSPLTELNRRKCGRRWAKSSDGLL